MRHLLVLAWLFVVATACAQAPPVSSVAMPDTPAGRFASLFIEVYNSPDPERIERYNRLYSRQSTRQGWMDLQASTGRITPVRVDARGPNEITVLLRKAS